PTERQPQAEAPLPLWKDHPIRRRTGPVALLPLSPLLSLPRARRLHRLLDDLRQPSHAGPGSVVIRKDEIKLRDGFAAVAQRNGLQRAGLQLRTDLLFGESRIAVAFAYRLHGGRHVADGPAARRID